MSSADLQFRRPNLQLSSLTLNLETESCTIQPQQINEDTCVTPTSPDHKIPAVITCPPAPKKQRRTTPSCRRTLSEFQFFEAVAREEIDSFFRSTYEFINQNSSKRKRC
ncbi:hypothetical protein QVD17_32387 [Tagetes erecta]|uniref:Cyclin-dependent kinase inhibitor n=1 Tax=Tagetes erecta TaxID=13708 RepID=A0AAD8NQ35_TARER|nr:hypothetical protein QVD17_32387 [Tagetes erecta]